MKSIYFTGSSGTGKTTQSLLVSSVLKMPIVDGISRNSPFLMGTSEHQQYVSRRVYRKCINMNAVHCRTPIDVAAYTKINGVDSPLDDQHCSEFAKTNPVVVYFPMLDHIEDDGFRPTDYEFNFKVDYLVKKYLDYYGIEYLSLSSDNPDDRANEITTYYWRRNDSKTVLEQPRRISDVRDGLGRSPD